MPHHMFVLVHVLLQHVCIQTTHAPCCCCGCSSVENTNTMWHVCEPVHVCRESLITHWSAVLYKGKTEHARHHPHERYHKMHHPAHSLPCPMRTFYLTKVRAQLLQGLPITDTVLGVDRYCPSTWSTRIKALAERFGLGNKVGGYSLRYDAAEQEEVHAVPVKHCQLRAAHTPTSRMYKRYQARNRHAGGAAATRAQDMVDISFSAEQSSLLPADWRDKMSADTRTDVEATWELFER
jgi:hypothetical protein